MADRKYPITFEFIDENVAKGIREIRDAMQQTVKQSDETKKSVNDAFKEVAKNAHDYQGAIKQTNEAVEENNKKTRQQNDLLKDLGRELKNRLNDIKVFGVGVGDISEKLGKLTKGGREFINQLRGMKKEAAGAATNLLKAAAGSKAFSLGLKAVGLGLKALGIGLVIAAVAALLDLLSRSEEVMDKVSDATAGVKAAFSGLIQVAGGLGRAALKFLKGDFAGASEEAHKATASFKSEVIDAAKEAANYNKVLRETKKVMDSVSDATRANAVRFVELDDTINSSLSTYSEKMDAINTKRNIELSLLDATIIQQRKAVEAAAQGADKKEQELVLEELKAERLGKSLGYEQDIRDLNAEQVKIGEQRRKQQAQEVEDQRKIAETLEGMISSLQEKYGKLNAKSLSTLARINEEEKIAINELEDRLNDIADYYKEHYGDLIDLVDIGESARLAVTSFYAKKRQDIITGANEDIEKKEKDSYDDRVKELNDFLKDVEDDIREAMDLDTLFPEDPFGKLEAKFRDFISNVFRVKPEDMNEFLDSAKTVLSEVISQWTQFTDIRIQQNERLLDSIREQKAEYRDLLDQEIEDAAAGYRNDVSNAKERYEEIMAAEKKAIRESEKLKKQQIIIAETTTGIVTALNLAKAASEMAAKSAILGPIAGPISFAIGMGAILLTFKKIKNQIDSIKLYEGGSMADAMIRSNTRDHGFVDKTQGRNDKYTRGHRVEGTNLEIGGQEYVNNSGISLRYAEFLDRFNAGKLNHIDFNAIGRKTVKTHPVFNPRSSTMSAIRSHSYASSGLTKEDLKKVMVEVFPALFDKNGQMVSDTIKRKKGLAYKPDGTRVEYDDNRRVEVN